MDSVVKKSSKILGMVTLESKYKIVASTIWYENDTENVIRQRMRENLEFRNKEIPIFLLENGQLNYYKSL